MSEEETANNSKPYIKIRHCILNTLYEFFKEYPYASIELWKIREKCNADPKELNWNIVYLEKCGFVELSKSFECPPYVACSVTITDKGIDLVENEAEFRARFPVE